MPTRDSLHRLIDALPEAELAAAARFLQYLRATTDPVLRALLDAPLDEEPETAEERRLVQEARDELAQGQVQTLEAVRRELGVCAGRSSSPPAPNGTDGGSTVLLRRALSRCSPG